MFPYQFEIETPDLLTVRGQRKMNSWLKLVMAAGLRFWLIKFFDRHFSLTAFTRYGSVYTKRKGRRRSGKKGSGKRAVAQGRPNFKTGDMKRALERSARVRGTVKEMTLSMTGPFYTNLPGRVDKADEISFVSESERETLARKMEKTLQSFIDADTGVVKQRIR